MTQVPEPAASGAGHDLIAGAAILLLALLLRRYFSGNADVAWLLTLAEKWLDGQRLYVDLLEINPPFSVWLYAPAAALARRTGLRAETALDLGVLLLSMGALQWSARLIGAARINRRVAVPALAALTILPAGIFAEREHIALVCFLPLLALTIRRARGESASVWSAAAVGVASGVVLCIKPHFALATGGAALAAAILRREARLLVAPEHLVAGLLFVAYVAGAFILYPAFWSDMLPLIALLYLPARAPLVDMFNGALPLLAVELALAAIWLALKNPRAVLSPEIAPTGAAIAGFFVAAIAQGKGWPYHFYPAFGLTLVLLCGVALASDTPRARAVLACAGALGAQLWLLSEGGVDMRPIEAALRAQKPNPRVIALASDFAVAFPAVRNIGGIWVGRSFSRWIPHHARGLAAQPGFDRALLPAFRSAEEMDRRQLAQDMAAGRPDLVIIERRPFDFLAWAGEDRELAALLTCFRPAARALIGALDKPGGDGFDIEIHARDANAAADCPAERPMR